MDYWDEWSTPTRSIIVFEEGGERPSLVLQADGEPYSLIKKSKIGFDLTPKGVTNGATKA